MLSGELRHHKCSARKRWNTTIGLISKNNFARAAHFFVHFFAVVLHDYNLKADTHEGFCFIDSFVVSPLQEAGGYAISRQNNLELHWVTIPVDRVILHWYTCGADGRFLGVRSRDYQIFSDG